MDANRKRDAKKEQLKAVSDRLMEEFAPTYKKLAARGDRSAGTNSPGKPRR